MRWWSRGVAFSLGLAALGAAGCSNASDPATPEGEGAPVIEVKRSGQHRAGPGASKEEVAAVAEGNNAFAFDLYGKLQGAPEGQGKNLFFSPLSLTLALGMTSAGARGQTATEIAQVMHFTLPQASLQPALNTLALGLLADADPDPNHVIDEKDRTGNRLDIVNALWGEKTEAWAAPFLDVLAVHYGAGVSLGDFRQQPEAERLVINQWVANQTNQHIKELLAPGSLDASTRLVLVNAINLAFAWASPFAPEHTKKAPFAVEGGASVTVDLMAQTLGEGRYAEDDLAQYTTLQLSDRALSVELFVPKPGRFHDFEAALPAATEALRKAANPSGVSLSLPRFSFTSPAIALGPALRQLGMHAAFAGGADFSGMTASEPLQLGEVYHKAMVGIDEEGIEAAAATGVSIEESGSTSWGVVRVDRSFFLGIRDARTGALLFFGRILDPTGG